ncbi:hypothetical protein [Bradyrhizobium archetypum]|uniref:Uncharacterized protein n=1 Tax=Bradyrhizobium archetypum TaxID=2721160 RepID=A0A7Y4H9K8_9BRAD|nr:hypothetical protein [Bradyrhizobium archetypum]
MGQTKHLYDSFNKHTNANEIGALLNMPHFKRFCPNNSYRASCRSQGRVAATSSTPPTIIFREPRVCQQQRQFVLPERTRPVRATDLAKHSMAQAVYDTAFQRARRSHCVKKHERPARGHATFP